MARVNIWIPDQLHEQAKAAKLNVSRLAQAAIRSALGSLPEPAEASKRLVHGTEHRSAHDLQVAQAAHPETCPHPRELRRTGKSGLRVCGVCQQVVR